MKQHKAKPNFHIKRTRTNRTKRNFIWSATKLFNDLPKDIKLTTEVTKKIKTKLRRYYREKEEE